MFKARFVLNIIFLIIIFAIAIHSLINSIYILNAILAVSYLWHWRKGIDVYFDHEHVKKSKFLYFLYLLIGISIIIGFMNYTKAIVFFISFSIAFLCAMPALLMIKSKRDSDYKKRKIILDIVAFSGFILSGIGCYYNLLDIQFIIILNILGHALAILYILRVKLYE